MSLRETIRARAARRFEDDLARDLNARRVFLSGAGTEKADVRKRALYARRLGVAMRLDTLTLRVEAKTTKNAHYTFRSVDWWDLVRAADGAVEIPVFAVRFLGGAVSNSELVLVRKGFASELGADTAYAGEVRLDKSRIIRAHDANYRVAIEHTHEVLYVMHYPDFLEKLYAHPDFRGATPPNAP